MESVINGIETLFTSISGTVATRVEKLPQSGSDRIYFRIYEGSKTYIATYNLNQKETQTFIHFSKHFKTAGLPVPEVLGVNSDDTIYIQEDLGAESLLNQIEKEGHSQNVYALFQKV